MHLSIEINANKIRISLIIFSNRSYTLQRAIHMRTRLTDDRRQSLTAQIVVPTTTANRDNANMNENKSEFSQIRQSTHSKRTFAHTLTGANIHPNKQRSMHCHTKYPFKTMAGTYFCQVRRPDRLIGDVFLINQNKPTIFSSGDEQHNE